MSGALESGEFDGGAEGESDGSLDEGEDVNHPGFGGGPAEPLST